MTPAQLASALSISWFDYQLETLDAERGMAHDLRACLYYRTGAGKTYTALALLRQDDLTEAVVLAPPATHKQWQAQAEKLGMNLTLMSHAKFRQKTTKLSKHVPMVVDEFHLLGGHTGKGWEKMRIFARHTKSALVILSATPNYNDVERVYCVANVLDPHGTKGGYLDWLFANCTTRNNPFGSTPLVEGFADGNSARAHLAALPHVYHVEDPHENFPVAEIVLDTELPQEMKTYGLDHRRLRLMASRMEQVSAARKQQLLRGDGRLQEAVVDPLSEMLGMATGPVMIFCARSTIATAVYQTIYELTLNDTQYSTELVTFDSNRAKNELKLERFKEGKVDVLVGTATMSTGVDGLDRVCDMLILLDDTDDDSLRRQVIGRILPRGATLDASKKLVVRFVLGDSWPA